MNARTASKIVFTVVGVVALCLGGCGAPPDGPESVGTSGEELTKVGSSSGGGLVVPTCNGENLPSSECSTGWMCNPTGYTPGWYCPIGIAGQCNKSNPCDGPIAGPPAGGNAKE